MPIKSKRHLPLSIARLDQRSTEAFRLKKAYFTIVKQLGGEESLTHLQLGAISEYVFLEYEVQELQARIAIHKSEKLMMRWTHRRNLLAGLRKQLNLDIKTVKEHAVTGIDAITAKYHKKRKAVSHSH